MKRLLIKTKKYKLFHIVNGVEIDGEKPNMAGDCTGLRGDAPGYGVILMTAIYPMMSAKTELI